MSEDKFSLDDDNLDFSGMSWIELPVRAPDNGEELVLREASGEDARVFNNARMQGIVLEDGKPRELRNQGDLEILLVSLCLRGEQGRRIHANRIGSWQERVVKKLYNKAYKISNLDESKDPIRKGLELVLNRADSPVTIQKLREYVNGFEHKDLKALKDLLKEDGDELKNLRESTTGGSESHNSSEQQ